MKENNLRHIDGKKIRRPWFGYLLAFSYACMLLIPYFIWSLTHLMGKYNPADWPSTLWMSVYLGFFFSLPFLLLRILSQHCFGKILCVLTAEGIHHPTGMLPWEDIEKIEYAMDEKPRGKDDNGAMFRTVFYKKNGTLTVISKTPLSFLVRIRKYRKEIPVSVTGISSILFIVLITAAWILPVPYGVFLLRNAPGCSKAEVLVTFALTLVLMIARRLVTTAYQIDYRIFRWILPKKWLYYVLVWHEVAAIYLGILLLAHHPTWWGIALTALYLGLGTGWIRRPSYGRATRFWSYEDLYERYVTKSEMWEKEIQWRRAKHEKRRKSK